MPRQDIEFKTGDGVILRGWLYTPPAAGKSPAEKLPCLVMVHGFSALKEMALNTFAERFVSKLQLAVLVYDNRGFGASDVAVGQPRQEIIPNVQISDYQDAITYAQSLPEVDAENIGVWGTSYSGGHVLYVAAVDRRVKACISQVPCVNGWDNFHRLIRPDFVASLNAAFQSDRQARAAGNAAATIPVVSADPLKQSALPTPDSYKFFSEWEKKCGWKNEVTVRTIEAFRAYYPAHFIHRISPTPLFMVVQANDCLTPADLTFKAYARALEPKKLLILKGGHFDAYGGENFEINVAAQMEFLQGNLCK